VKWYETELTLQCRTAVQRSQIVQFSTDFVNI